MHTLQNHMHAHMTELFQSTKGLRGFVPSDQQRRQVQARIRELDAFSKSRQNISIHLDVSRRRTRSIGRPFLYGRGIYYSCGADLDQRSESTAVESHDYSLAMFPRRCIRGAPLACVAKRPKLVGKDVLGWVPLCTSFTGREKKLPFEGEKKLFVGMHHIRRVWKRRWRRERCTCALVRCVLAPPEWPRRRKGRCWNTWCCSKPKKMRKRTR